MTQPHIVAAIAAALLGYCGAQAPACRSSESQCEFWLEVREAITMQNGEDLLYPGKGQIFRDKGLLEPVTDGFIQADGWNLNTRLVMVVNGTMPGPALHVYKDQTVIVHVTNRFESETLTIHWHGIHQYDTPYMDGVPFVSQCPILPGQTFDYRFRASPLGTHWYHSHSGAQRTNGVHGAFIVHPRSAENITNEFIMVLSEWHHDYESMTGYVKMKYALFDGMTRYSPTFSLDGAAFSMLQFQSGLINGKGRYYNSTRSHNGAPLHRFDVQPNTTYRFRVIGAGALYPFRVSIDEHPLKILATDGYDIVPEVVESFVINPGERIDFEIYTNATPANNYWVRALSLEHNVTNHIAEAVLSYSGANRSTDYDKVVNSRRQNCTQSNPCRVVNCPFQRFPRSYNSTCLHYTDLTSIDTLTDDVPGADGDYEEIFLNFAFPGEPDMPGSCNGKKFVAPSSLAYEDRRGFTDCAKANCSANKPCPCTFTVDLDYGKTYQIIFLNLGEGKGWGHPMHLHGHSFYVVRTAFGHYNESFMVDGDTPDVICHNSFCSDASWSNDGTQPNKRPRRWVQKDTITVPTGGYVAVRVKADNPGIWLMHCHIDMHHMEGMAALVDSGAKRRPVLPLKFPTCGNYYDKGVKTSSAKHGVQQMHAAVLIFLATPTISVIILQASM